MFSESHQSSSTGVMKMEHGDLGGVGVRNPGLPAAFLSSGKIFAGSERSRDRESGPILPFGPARLNGFSLTAKMNHRIIH